MIETFNIEFLPWLDPVYLPEFRWQDDLTLGRYGRFHSSKISSYGTWVNAVLCNDLQENGRP